MEDAMLGMRRWLRVDMQFPLPATGRAGGVIRLAAIVTAGAVALAGCSSKSTTSTSTSTPAGPSSTTSQATSTTTAPPPPTVAPDHLSSLLLVPQEANPIMGATGMQDIGGLGSPDTNIFATSPPDCLGAAHIVQPSVYGDSGYTAILFDVQHEPGNRYTHSIEQAVTSYPSADQALAFFTGQVGKWKACAGKAITDTLKGDTDSWDFGDLVGDAPKIAMRYNRHNARGWTCQRVLDAVLNVVIDVKACAYKIDNQGTQVADKIAAKATQ
jgi:PknH-like extracellular domain